MKCEYCDHDVDPTKSIEIIKRIKRGEGVYHDECWKKEFIEKFAYKK